MSEAPLALFLAPSAYLWGGVQTWLDQTAEGLRARGWRSALGLVGGPRFHDPLLYSEVHPGHRVVPIRCETGTPEGRARAIVRALDAERPAVLVIANIADGLEGARRWRETGRSPAFRVAYSIHAFLPGQFADLIAYGGTVDRVVSTNRLLQEALVETLGSDSPVGYAPYGAEAPIDAGTIRPVRPRPLRLAWVGRLEEPQKRSSEVADVLNRCHELGVDFTCQVAGDGPSAPRLRERLSRLVEAGRVSFPGFLSRQDLYRHVYPNVDALLLTSTWETGPIVAWEAMRHGACLVSTRYVGLRQEGALVDGENCLLAPVGDVEGLARALERLSLDEALVERLASSAKRTADERYSLERSADAWDRELRAALASPARPATPRAGIGRASGRLDRLFGTAVAEALREGLARKGRPDDPGDEWPHGLPWNDVPLEPIRRRLESLLQAGGECEKAAVAVGFEERR